MDAIRKQNPSFSSSLLDVIYRSIDERDDEKCAVYRKPTKPMSIDDCFQFDHKPNADSVPPSGGGAKINISDARKSATGFETSSFCFNSNTASSDSRYGAGAETIYGFPARPRPIRTNIHDDECCRREIYDQDLQPKANCQGKFLNTTKSRAMKICSYLKKGKHPISPGGRLATLLFSLFSTTNTKIPSPGHANTKPNSTPSSASSFSRSSLNKTPSSSRANLTADMKQSVGFYPANPGSDSPGVQFARNSVNGELKNRRTEDTAMNTLNNYRRKVKFEFGVDSIKTNVTNNDDDEAASYASSDLFELDHLSAIGMDRCMQELPLYETTSVDANRAIVNGLLV